MGYPGDDGGGPPGTRRSAIWAADPDQDIVEMIEWVDNQRKKKAS